MSQTVNFEKSEYAGKDLAAMMADVAHYAARLARVADAWAEDGYYEEMDSEGLHEALGAFEQAQEDAQTAADCMAEAWAAIKSLRGCLE